MGIELSIAGLHSFDVVVLSLVSNIEVFVTLQYLFLDILIPK